LQARRAKKFSVWFQKVEDSLHALRGNVYLDGMAAEAGLLLPNDMRPTCISGQTRLEGIESPFMFARLRTTDDETEACRDERHLDDLGTIRVKMDWVTILRQETWRPATTALSDAMKQPIYERSKKASSHCASLGDVAFVRPRKWYATTVIPGTDPVEFVVQYAPLDWLRAEGIAPMPAPDVRKRRASTAQNDHSDLELLDPEEVAVYRPTKDKMANGRPAKRVKQEHPEVIDLTGDD